MVSSALDVVAGAELAIIKKRTQFQNNIPQVKLLLMTFHITLNKSKSATMFVNIFYVLALRLRVSNVYAINNKIYLY